MYKFPGGVHILGYKFPAGVQISWRGTNFLEGYKFLGGYKFLEGVQISWRGTYLGGVNFILQITSKCMYFEGTNFLRGTYNFTVYIFWHIFSA